VIALHCALDVTEEELLKELGSIDEITGALYIQDSNSLTSLRFLSKLQIIGSEIGKSKYAGYSSNE
jgi:Receptor L domain